MSTRAFVTALKDIVAPLAGASEDLPLSEVNAYNKKTNLSFPAMNFSLEDDGIEVERDDSDHNFRITEITARLIFPNKDGEDAELARLDVLDAVLDKLDERATIDTLGAIQEIWEVTQARRFEVDEPEPLIGFEFKFIGRNSVEFT